MKLYECQRNDIVKLLDDDVRIPVASPDPGDVVIFHHIDGMYSYCKTMDGKLVHPAAWTEVMIVGKYEDNK